MLYYNYREVIKTTKKQYILDEQFKIGDIVYNFKVSTSFCATLLVVSGKTKAGTPVHRYDSFGSYLSEKALGDNYDALPVLRKCVSYLFDILKKYQPNRLRIQSVYDIKRARAYHSICKRYIKKVKNYNVVYQETNNSGYLTLYKQPLDI